MNEKNIIFWLCDRFYFYEGRGVSWQVRQSSVPSEPRECALDDPAPWKKRESLGDIGGLDDLQSPFSDSLQSSSEFGADIAAIGKNITKLGRREPIPILDIDGMNH